MLGPTQLAGEYTQVAGECMLVPQVEEPLLLVLEQGAVEELLERVQELLLGLLLLPSCLRSLHPLRVQASYLLVRHLAVVFLPSSFPSFGSTTS